MRRTTFVESFGIVIEKLRNIREHTQSVRQRISCALFFLPTVEEIAFTTDQQLSNI